ncbi:hypothetical protein pdam_00018445 [Pocillopora damicornis]|uniref:Uncharacterized protein n=1 Tax=Pocillopora damicornis TaxID=46731 RepID=A0A3M6UBG4_POCDA|nr:hypothetical protein pdam_00018445 [Pocillopora damicornis]
MESFLDPRVEQLLSKKTDTQRLQAIAFSIACLCTGPTPFQPPDYFHIPKNRADTQEESDEGESEEIKESKSL